MKKLETLEDVAKWLEKFNENGVVLTSATTQRITSILSSHIEGHNKIAERMTCLVDHAIRPERIGPDGNRTRYTWPELRADLESIVKELR